MSGDDAQVRNMEDISGQNTIEDDLASLNRLIGLVSAKKRIKTLYERIKLCGDSIEPGHYVFMGNPGTGKTEVAWIMGKLLKSLGLLGKGHVVEASRNELVGAYVGQTAIKTVGKCKEALGGILLVDEAYRLTDDPHDTFGRESFESVMQFMEDNRARFCVAFTGYKDQMERLLEINPGLKSRISDQNIIEFPDYTADELSQILALMANTQNFKMDQSFITGAREIFEYRVTHKTVSNANARDVRNMLKESIGNLANRLTEESKRGVIIPDTEKRTLIRSDLDDFLKLIKTEETK